MTETVERPGTPPEPGYSMFPLSAEQRRLWLVHQVTPRTTAYHVPVALRVRGPLDVAAMRGAVADLVARHEALRTSIRCLGETPYQHVPDVAELDFRVVDVPAGTDPADLVREAAYQPFDLAEGPLLRTRVVRVGPDEHVLLICVHHIVVDAWSLRLMLAELDSHYRARRYGEPVTEPAVPVQYADYAVWQGEQAAANGDALAYWRRELADAPAYLSVAEDETPTGPATAAEAGSVYAVVDHGVAAGVRALAARLRTTPMAVLLTAWATVLARRTGRSDVSVLVPVANRGLPETERLIGFFVNLLVLRVDLADAATYADVLTRVHERCAAAYAHQDLPYDQLVDELRPERQLGRTPFSDVMFGFQDLTGDLAWHGLDVSPVDLPPRHAKCELTVEVRTDAAGLRVQADYRRDRFGEPEIRALVDGFAETLRQLAGDVSGRVELPHAPGRNGSRQPRRPSPEAPRDPRQQRVRELLADLLEIPAGGIGVHDDFFRLGGNSLLAARFVSRVRTEYGADPGLRTFLERPTVAGLARWLDEQQRRDEQPADGDVPLEAVPRLGAGEPWRVPVSYPQQRLWFLDQMTPGSTAYHVPVVLRVAGRLDVAALRRALSALADRHEMLRTSFERYDGVPVQRVHATVEVPVRYVDLTAGPPASEPGDAERLIAEESSRPFDLGQAPLLRLLAVRLAAEEHLLLLTLHHIVCDGASARILVRDLTALYLAETGGPAPDLPDLPVQYADFASWQRGWLSGERLAELETYWRTALSGAPTVLQLPYDRPRPAAQSYRGAELRFGVPPPVAEGVRQLAARYAMTPFMVLLVAVGITLSRYAGQPQVLIGTPVANRTRPETEDLIGFFANTLALRVDTSGNPTVADLLARVRATCLAGYAHQDLPFEKVVEAVAPARDLSTTPLFQVMLALEAGTLGPIELPGLRIDRAERDAGVGKFDLTLVFEDLSAGGGVARYHTDLFDEATVERLVGSVLRVLEQLVAAPERTVADLDVLSEAERHQQLEQWNRAPAEYATDVPLHRLVRRQIAASPDAVAVAGCLDCHADEPCTAPSGHLTYRELGDRADRVAAALAGRGVGRGDVVAILLDRSADLVVAELATLTVGAGFLPLDPGHPPLRNAAIVSDAGCRIVLTHTRYADRVTDALLVDQLPECYEPVPEPQVGTRDLAYAIYTSGSTGRPKGALVGHGAIVNNLRWMQQEWPLTPDDRLLFKTVHTFDVAVKEIFWPLLAGARLVIAHPGAERDAYEICQHIARHRATVVHLVPSMLDVVLEVSRDRKLALSSLRIVMAGAESLSPATHDAILAALPALLLHLYGPTETAIAVTGWPCRESVRAARLPLGRAMPNSRLYVLDDHLRPLPQGCAGELYVGGQPVGLGYLARPAETAAAFLPDPFTAVPGERMYRTGDLVRYRNDGLLEFRGRRDSQVKIRGLRVEPGEVTATLTRHPGVRQAAVMPWPRTRGDASDRPVSLVAYVVGDPDLTPASVREFLRERLPAYLVPAYVELLAALPTGKNGKVDYDRLPAPAAGRPESEPPNTAVERRLAEIWCEVLELPSVGVHDDFFDVGGHSLLATRLSSRIRDEFGTEIPLRTLFEQPTIAALATLVQGEDQAKRGDRIPVVDRSAYRLPED